MYSTSNGYKDSLVSGLIRSRVELSFLTKSGESFVIADDKILPNSLSINNRATGSNEFSFGSVYVGELNVTLIDVGGDIDRYSLFGAEIVATLVQIISDVEEERIPLGKFYVSNPNRKQKMVTIEAYDAMTNFDVGLTESTFGTPYELLVYLCNKCGVELGQTGDEINNMVNGTRQLSLAMYQDMTARDAISNIAKVLCGFATIDRNGKLVIRGFHTEPDFSIGSGSRISSTIADYRTYFVGVTAKVVVNGAYLAVTKQTGRIDGLLLDLGEIPVAQGTEGEMNALVKNIADELLNVDFVPMTAEIISDPSINLGDMLTMEDVNNTDDSVDTIVTAYDWVYHGRMKITGDGKNALLGAVKSNEIKQISEIQNMLQNDKYAVKTYTNSRQFDVGGSDTVVINMQYSAFTDTTAVFIATVPIDVDLDGEIVITYRIGIDDVGTLRHYVQRGHNVITISNYFPSEKDAIVSLKVYMRCEYFESDKRQNDAKISGLIDAVETGEYIPAEIDTTVPQATIDVAGIKASVFASGINTTETWDGTLSFEDRISVVDITSRMNVYQLTDVPSIVSRSDGKSATVQEVISAIGIKGVSIGISRIDEAITFGRTSMCYTIDTSRSNYYVYNRSLVNVVNDAFVLSNTVNFESVTRVINDVEVESVTINKRGIAGAGDVEVIEHD